MSVTGLSCERANPVQIECLACGATRSVFGAGHLETGECPRCHYLGWASSEELDGSMRRMIMNGGLAAAAARRRRRG